MPRWKTLLVPTDLTPASAAALRTAAEIAHETQGKVYLVHAAELPPGLGRETPIRPLDGALMVPVGDFIEGAVREELARLAQGTRAAFPGLELETRIDFGAATAVILDLIDDLKPDLVVLGTHGRTGFAHLMLGSVAEKIVRRSRVPVLTVHGPEGGDDARLTGAEAQAQAEAAG